MLDEKKTQAQLIHELTALEETLAAINHPKSQDDNPHIRLHRVLEWKDFLLGLHEKAFYMSDQELYGYVLDEIVHLTGSEIGFFHVVSDDQQSVILTKWNGKALKYCTASYENHYPIADAGNWVDCVRQKRPVVYNDFDQSPNRKGLPPGHNPIHRFMSVPVIEQGKVRIIFGVGNKPEAYDDEDIYQTQLVANNLQIILTRRNAERKLLESEERLSLSLQATRDGIWDWNIPTMSGYGSPNYYAMLGMEVDEIPLNSEDWWHLIHPDDAVKVRQAMDRVLEMRPTEHDQVPFVEFRMRKKTGEWCWILARGKVVAWDDDGRPLRMVGTHTDITERKQAEEALRNSEERYRTLFETANDAILLLDQDLNYVDCNSKALEMTQRSRDELLGHRPLEFCPVLQANGRESRATLFEHFNTAAAGESLKFYWQTMRKDGTVLDLEVSLNTVTLGGRKYTQVIARDITEQRKNEEILKESEGKFRDLVEEAVAGVYLIQNDHIEYANAKLAEIFGYEMDELIGSMNIQDIILPEDMPLVRGNIRKRMVGETKGVHYGFRIKRKSGEIRHVEVYSSITNYQGKPAIIGIAF